MSFQNPAEVLRVVISQVDEDTRERAEQLMRTGRDSDAAWEQAQTEYEPCRNGLLDQLADVEDAE